MRSIVSREKKDRELTARNRLIGTEVAPTTSSRDLVSRELFDPAGESVSSWYIGELRPRCGRRDVARTVARTQQQNCHLSSGDGRIGTELAATASGGRSASSEPLDEAPETMP